MRSPRPVAAAVVLLAFAVVALAGCGGNSRSSATTASKRGSKAAQASAKTSATAVASAPAVNEQFIDAFAVGYGSCLQRQEGDDPEASSPVRDMTGLSNGSWANVAEQALFSFSAIENGVDIDVFFMRSAQLAKTTAAKLNANPAAHAEVLDGLILTLPATPDAKRCLASGAEQLKISDKVMPVQAGLHP